MSTMGHSVHTKCQTVVESSHFREKGIQAVIMVLPMSLSGLTLLSTVAAVSAEIHHHFYLSVGGVAEPQPQLPLRIATRSWPTSYLAS